MSQLPLHAGVFAPPGFQSAVETFENQFWMQNWLQMKRLPVVVSGASRDTGNTPNTKLLRMGLAMGGPIDASATDEYQVKQWDITATDGSQYFLGFLLYSLTMYDQLAADQDRYCDLMIGGSVYSDRIIIPGETNQGVTGNNANLLVSLAQQRFTFDKHVKHVIPKFPLPPIVLGTSPVTLTAAHQGRIFLNTGAGGAKTVNLPAPLPGLGPFRFHANVDQDIVLDAGAATFIAPGNVAADTITIATAGAFAEVIGISTTQYLVTDTAGTLTPA